MKIQQQKLQLLTETPKPARAPAVELGGCRTSLKLLRDAYLAHDFGDGTFTAHDITYIQLCYSLWVKQPTYLSFLDLENRKVVVRRAAKRGNAVYRKIINERIDNAIAQLEASDVVSLCVRPDKSGRGHVSNVFFITLTWDPKKYPNQIDAWTNDLSEQYNTFITNLRSSNRFGKSWVWRVYEATKKGYPHVHLLVVCEQPQPVFKHKKEWRLCSKSVVADCWSSHVDVKAAYNIKSVSAYLSKDLRKQINVSGEQGKVTAALCWLFKKRSYAISTNFDLIEACIIQEAPVLTQLKEAKKSGLIFLGVISIQSFKGAPPPDNIELPLTAELLREMNKDIAKPSPVFERLLFEYTGIIRGYDL